MKGTDHKGFTLVELLVSISISVIVMSSIAYLTSYSSRNYRRASEDVSLQMEAQTIINQLDDLIMEAYNVKYDSNLLTIYQEDANYLIFVDTAKQKLLFEKVLPGETPTGDYIEFGRFVENFQVVDTGADDRNNVIEISIDLRREGKSYSIKENKVTLRNHIKQVTDLE